MSSSLINQIKSLTEDFIELNELEGIILQQRAKIQWMKMGDDNNSSFYAHLKAKYHSNKLLKIRKQDGTTVQSQQEIANEVLDFYGNLMGSDEGKLNQIDIVAMRMGKQLTLEQRESLVKNIFEEEIYKALDGIGDLKAPGLDGFGAKFFKANWKNVKDDVIVAVREFFK